MESDTYGLAWAIEDSEDKLVRSEGSAYWIGLANSYFLLDKEKDIAIVYFTNFFPYGDKETVDFYRLFEKKSIFVLKLNNDLPTMAVSNCPFSLLLKTPQEFSAWCLLLKLIANPRNYS